MENIYESLRAPPWKSHSKVDSHMKVYIRQQRFWSFILTVLKLRYCLWFQNLLQPKSTSKIFPILYDTTCLSIQNPSPTPLQISAGCYSLLQCKKNIRLGLW